ncbi:hypothetical protein EYZ11_003715 [Aspergillus tanneri]|uniref:Uncharacterized protein n=1 Tax=Aspergillus tanneri TaxID=1220188 RepID=A0A4S3JMY3_9EURO|nr:hypothetical protein EYZ11_003715 [Aspergillus tanneri]
MEFSREYADNSGDSEAHYSEYDPTSCPRIPYPKTGHVSGIPAEGKPKRQSGRFQNASPDAWGSSAEFIRPTPYGAFVLVEL